MKPYNEILAELKAKGMKHREAQMKASELFKAQKEDVPFEVKDVIKPVIKPRQKYEMSINPDEVEAAIRAAGVNIHSIQSVSRNFSPNFQFVKAGKDGVNTKVYLDGPCRVPANGFFKVWI